MQQVRPNRGAVSSAATRSEVPVIVRTDLSSLLNEYTSSQRRYDDRLQFLEREMASLKGQVNQVITSSDEHELSQTFTAKKSPSSSPSPARTVSPSRIPLPIASRKLSGDNTSIVSNKSGSITYSPPMMARSRTFHNGTSPVQSANVTEENNLLRSYKVHLEQALRQDAAPGSEIKIPNYTCLEDVIKANEQLLLENERLRSDLNRLKTESILLLRSMKTATIGEINSGNERITAERERQELSVELARQVEENKRLRKSLLAQSEKFLTLRQSVKISDASLTSINDQDQVLESTSQIPFKSTRTYQSKSARHNSDNRGSIRPRSLHQGLRDPS